MAITTTSVLPPAVQLAYSYKLLSVPTPEYIHTIPALRQAMPSHKGDKIRFRRPNRLPASPVPLGNSGVTTPSVELTAVNVDAQIKYYGQWIAINEQVALTNEDPVLNMAAERLGASLRETEDMLTRDMLAGSAAHINCTGGVNGRTPSEISREDVDGIIRTLKGNNAKAIFSGIEGENKYGTAPIRESYFAMCHTDLIGDLERVQGFASKVQYPNQQKTLDAEWGNVSNMRFLVSSIGSYVPGASVLVANNKTYPANVYNIFCVGLEAYGVVDQNEYSAKFIYRPPYLDGPLAQNATVAWKMAQAQVLLNDQWALVLRCTLSQA